MKTTTASAFIMGVCILLALVAGCTQPSTPAATPVPTAVVTAVEATAAPTAVPTTADSITPGPTQTLPEIWSMEVQVSSNGESINPQITATLRGGKGMNVIPAINVKVTKSDGSVETGQIVPPLHVGSSVTLPGTTSNNDRAEVWVVTPNGDSVKIYDAYVPFRSYN